jgi:hypothetical protein
MVTCDNRAIVPCDKRDIVPCDKRAIVPYKRNIVSCDMCVIVPCYKRTIVPCNKSVILVILVADKRALPTSMPSSPVTSASSSHTTSMP